MPRMWMIDPATLCRRHLIAEHHETHVFAGKLAKGTKVTGYLDANLLEPAALEDRHDALVAEMIARGYNHGSPLDPDKVRAGRARLTNAETATVIDREKVKADLHGRCSECAELYRLKYPAP